MIKKVFIVCAYFLYAFSFTAFGAAPCIKHHFVSAKPDSGDATLINPSNWNECHDITLLFASKGSISGAQTVNWDSGTTQTATLIGNVTFTFTNPVAGTRYRLILTQDGTGGRTVTFPGSVRFPVGGVSTINSGAGQYTEVFFTYDGTNYNAFMPAAIGTQTSIHVSSNPSEGVWWGTDTQLWSNAGGVLTHQAYGNGSTAAYHLQVTSGTLPTGTLSEFTITRTPNQAFGGNYGRWSFTALGSAYNNTSGIYGEFGGTNTPTEFIFNIGYENPASTFTSYEPMRLMAGGDLGNVGFGVGATSGRNVIQLHVADIGSAGQRDSHGILWRGKSNDGSEHAVDWRAFVDVTSNAGASRFAFRNGVDVAPVDHFSILGVASAVNYIEVQAAATGSGATVASKGTDSNVNLRLVPQGTGKVTIPSIPSSSGTRYICINTAGELSSSASACSGT